MIEKRDCPICQSQQKKCLYKQNFSTLSGNLQLAGYDVVICADCGFAYADHIPNQDWFDSYYRNMSKYTYDQRDGQVSPIDRTRFKHIAQMIIKHLPNRNCSILDFGCATGGLLNQLKEAGYENLLGFEKTPSSAQVARQLYSLRVVNTTLQDIADREQLFALLILSGVLEHIRDIRKLLSELIAILKHNGLIYVEVPDAIGFDKYIENPFQEFSIEHINFFSSLSLINLFSCYGFEPVEVLRLTRDYTAVSKMPVLCGFFRMTGKNHNDRFFDDETGPALQKYTTKSLAEETRVGKIIDKLVESQIPLIVWGVGTYTLHLMKNTSFSQLNIIAFADSNKNYQNQTLLGKPILPPSELKSYSQSILISSYAFQAEIEDQIRRILGLPNTVITLKKASTR
jgi:SAM-dependent methyltransferase